MRFQATGIENNVVGMTLLTELMEGNGFVCAGGWDYERITFDYKFERFDEIYYLRVQGYATEGDIGAKSATVQLLTPIIGRYYYPHGIEYGEEEHFPEYILLKSRELLEKVNDSLKSLPTSPIGE